MRQFLILFLFVNCGSASAQVRASFDIGVGWYRMDDLTSFLKEIKNGFPVDAKITSSFPAYATYNGSIIWIYDEHRFFGLSFEYGSTGARISYSDYSGQMNSDILMHYNSLILSLGIQKKFQHGLSLHLNFKPGTTFTSLLAKDYLKVGTTENKSTFDLKSINATLQPTVEVSKRWNRFSVQFSAGYHASIWSGKLHPKGDKDRYLVDRNNEPINADWSGLRLSVGAGWYFGRLKNNE